MLIRVALALLTLVLVIVGLQNSEAVTIEVFFWKASLSLVVLLGISTGLGITAGLLLGIRRSRSRHAGG